MPLLAKNPQLLARFRRGERAALEEVYRHYVGRLERMVRHGFQLVQKNLNQHGVRVAGVRREDVGDLVQETFTRAFTERARLAYDGLRDYDPFLRTIARNLLIDRARRQGRELSLDELDEEPAAPEEEAAWADAATMKAVNDYLSALPVELKGVHEQRYVLGVSQEEAAKQLGLTRQRIRTLENKLREGLSAALARAGISADEDNQPSSDGLRIGKGEP